MSYVELPSGSRLDSHGPGQPSGPGNLFDGLLDRWRC